jgi:hypothetical protein
MRLRLLVPDLWLPPGMQRSWAGLRLPGLEFLLGRGTLSVLAAVEADAWLCEAFGVGRQADWPVAPLTLLADGGEPGRDFWFRADPVSMRADGAHLVLADSTAFSISRTEADTLTGTLNRHFAEDGLLFTPMQPERWYLRLPTTPALTTHPLAAAAGRDVDDHLPSGPDAMRWHGLLNEVQMALHEHAVNVEREARSEAAVNSVWFWGGGVLPERAAASFSAVWTDEPLAAGLARLAGLVPHRLPASLDDFLATAVEGGEHLLVLDNLRGAVRCVDPDGWREAMQAMEKDWFAPLRAALQETKISGAIIVSPGEAHTRSLGVERADLWKFWRGPRPLFST